MTTALVSQTDRVPAGYKRVSTGCLVTGCDALVLFLMPDHLQRGVGNTEVAARLYNARQAHRALTHKKYAGWRCPYCTVRFGPDVATPSGNLLHTHHSGQAHIDAAHV